jgi:hypothetical protein
VTTPGLSELEPYRLLAEHPQLAQDSILRDPAADPFTSLFEAVRQRNVCMISVSLAASMAKFAPLLLSNIPFYITQTWMTHVVTAWMTVGTLCLMILTLMQTLFTTRWPCMPVRPNTVAGSIYYVCDSFMLLDLEDMSTRSAKKRKELVAEMRARYRFGEICGMSGKTRIGVDYARDHISLQKEFTD